MILVTGGNGMLGRAVVEQLLEQGEPVRVFDLATHSNPEVDSFVGDIRNLAEIRQACTGAAGVIHTASLVDLHLGKPQRLYDINVLGVENLLAACLEKNVPKLVYMSTAEVISGAEPLRHVDESIPYPVPHLTYYGVTKEAAERLILAANDDALATCAIRTFGIFGEGDRNFVGRAIEKVQGKQIPQLGRNQGITDIVYAGNVAHGLISALFQLEVGNRISGHVFHLTDHAPQSMQDFLIDLLGPLGYSRSAITIPIGILKLMARLFELPYHLTKAERLADPLMTHHQILLATQDYYLNSCKACKHLGYTPRFTRHEAVARMQRWLDTALIKE
ncbi:MAG: NAD-dependent epimerase/dehydratase family protein [Chloroflexota bacterium]